MIFTKRSDYGLRAGTSARLLGFNGLVEKDLGRLTAHGLLPGVEVEVIQRVPAVILGLYQTELALESRLAAGVWVVPLQLSDSPPPDVPSQENTAPPSDVFGLARATSD